MHYFGAPYFSGGLGRFTSPDEPLNDEYSFDPQSWNMYSYGRNNPLKYTDIKLSDSVR
jgi:RHS repeat-associated protein